MRTRHVILGLVVLLAAGAAGFAALAWRPAIDPVAPPAAASFDPALVRRGGQLAAIGNCNSCHTAPGGRSLAGGVALPTPFGTIYATNITPDPDTGIGRWSEAAFARSMREGVDRAGSHLYPAFPYDHFTRVSDEDIHALYAYLMTRIPVAARAPANALPFPLNWRPVLAGWKLLFFSPGRFQPDPAQSPEWNRGAYLAEGLAHCGACHTPRNALGAEKADAHYAGGEAEGWHAYALNAASPAPVPWDAESLHAYLRQGWQAAHGVARGPMAEVTGNLGSVPDEDVRAIAAYVAAGMGPPSPERRRRGEALLAQTRPGGGAQPGPGARPQAADSQAVPPAPAPAGTGGEPGVARDANPGAAIYAAACATCHEAARPLPYGGINLALSTGIAGPTPENAANVVLHGLPASGEDRAPIMPGFAAVLDDGQAAALLTYLRQRFSGGPAWDNIDAVLREARSGARAATSRPMAVSSAPANSRERGSP